MTRYSVQTWDRTFVKGYGFLYFARDMEKIYLKIKVKM